jgi:uracil-DNA glycosylase family 4
LRTLLQLGRRLSVASKNDKRCVGCPLNGVGTGFARTDGSGDLDVLVVAEALGEDESKIGKPLVGKAGQTWNRIVTRTKDEVLNRFLVRDDFIHANVVNCRPPENILVGANYEVSAIDHCRGYLEETIREVKPKAILALGGVAMRWFTGEEKVTKLRGYVFETKYGPVIPTYHPSYIQRGNFHLARVVQTDITKALLVAREGVESLKKPKSYITHPSPQTAWDFVMRWEKAGRPPIAFDIETPKGSDAKDEELVFEDDESYNVLMCSFAFEPYRAISFPWCPPYIDIAKHIFASAPTTLVWNAKFDVPRLVAAGMEFTGEIIDAMIAWHWLDPALPMGLKYVATFACPDMAAWSLMKDMSFSEYNCADSDVLLRVYTHVQAKLAEQGRWEIFKRHFLDYGKILHKMTNRGIQVDNAARERGKEYFQIRYDGVVRDVQEHVPLDVKPLHPKKGYKKSEEELKKGKRPAWVEGEMRLIKVEVSQEEYDKHVQKLLVRSEREAKAKAPRVRKARGKKRLVVPVLPGLGLDDQHPGEGDEGRGAK